MPSGKSGCACQTTATAGLLAARFLVATDPMQPTPPVSTPLASPSGGRATAPRNASWPRTQTSASRRGRRPRGSPLAWGQPGRHPRGLPWHARLHAPEPPGMLPALVVPGAHPGGDETRSSPPPPSRQRLRWTSYCPSQLSSSELSSRSPTDRCNEASFRCVHRWIPLSQRWKSRATPERRDAHGPPTTKVEKASAKARPRTPSRA